MPEEIIHYDQYGVRYILDEAGNHLPPQQSSVDSKPGEFTTYDGSRGHCELCGRLTCNRDCFK